MFKASGDVRSSRNLPAFSWAWQSAQVFTNTGWTLVANRLNASAPQSTGSANATATLAATGLAGTDAGAGPEAFWRSRAWSALASAERGASSTANRASAAASV